ncbi:yippee putative zinc-binding protein [Teladorsagia circumcincta]|uniref:Yippee putative zinc-binding protein n=1 Tax=Teladorsagia circumcincta TaxID=45464 RepID=A0A2G9U752_TELCI|nr:yippee putative zinc-binding protein [Teladorsagia circumcincta]
MFAELLVLSDFIEKNFLVVLAPKYRHWFFPRMKVLESSNKDNQTQKTKTFQHYLPEGDRCYSCVHCRANLASHNDLISKSFQGSQGKAYLFNSVVNIGTGPAEERVLLTGLHAVADIYCQCCKTTLGWKYNASLSAYRREMLFSVMSRDVHEKGVKCKVARKGEPIASASQ